SCTSTRTGPSARCCSGSATAQTCAPATSPGAAIRNGPSDRLTPSTSASILTTDTPTLSAGGSLQALFEVISDDHRLSLVRAGVRHSARVHRPRPLPVLPGRSRWDGAGDDAAQPEGLHHSRRGGRAADTLAALR